MRRLCLTLLLLTSTATAEMGELRTWTSAAGSTIEAQFVRIQGTMVVLQKPDGTHVKIRKRSLSNADNDYLENEAPIPLDERLTGNWWGWQVPNRPAHHDLVIRRTAMGLVGHDRIRKCLTRDEAEQVRKKSLKPGDVHRRAWVAEQKFKISIDGDTVMMKGYAAKMLFAPDPEQTYHADELTLTYKAPGVLTGRWNSPGETNSGPIRLAKEGALDTPPPLALAKGKVHVDLQPVDGGPYHYRLYLPNSYDHSKPTPVLINLSPGGNAGPLSTKAAEKHGWIMVGLKENSNGADWAVSRGNTMTAMFDCMRRFNVDRKRFYFSGLSGGSRRTASNISVYPDFAAGAICIGAGYLYDGDGTYYIPRLDKPIFFITGTNDRVVKDEVIRFHKEAVVQGRVTKIATHTQGHSWGPPNLHEEAIDWLEYIAKQP